MSIEYITGTTAAAEAARLAMVDVVAAYPITPQTHVVTQISQYVYDGRLKAELVPVESEHSAMSASVGAAMVGARAFTASSSQGLELMHEVLSYASGLRLPIVMAVANRSVASPVTIFTDHQDALMQRETGFIHFFLENCQEILDIILLAYKVAEDKRVLLPVMASFDGFFLSHISEPVEVPDIELTKRFLPKNGPNYPIMDVADPKSFNVMAFPDTFEEFQRDKYESMANASAVFDEASEEFENLFGRKHNRLETYRTDDAEFIFFGLGSMMGTVYDAVDELREDGKKVGCAKIKCYRPFPIMELKNIVANCKAIGVLDRDVGYGSGGILYQDVCRSLVNTFNSFPIYNFILGLGGRDVSKKTINKSFQILEKFSNDRTLAPADGVVWPDENLELLKTWKVR